MYIAFGEQEIQVVKPEHAPDRRRCTDKPKTAPRGNRHFSDHQEEPKESPVDVLRFREIDCERPPRPDRAAKAGDGLPNIGRSGAS